MSETCQCAPTEIGFPEHASNWNPHGAALSADGSKLYAGYDSDPTDETSAWDPGVYAWNYPDLTYIGRVVSTLAQDDTPAALAVDANDNIYFWLRNLAIPGSEHSDLYVWNGSTLTLLGTYHATEPGLVWHPSDGNLWSKVRNNAVESGVAWEIWRIDPVTGAHTFIRKLFNIYDELRPTATPDGGLWLLEGISNQNLSGTVKWVRIDVNTLAVTESEVISQGPGNTIGSYTPLPRPDGSVIYAQPGNSFSGLGTGYRVAPDMTIVANTCGDQYHTGSVPLHSTDFGIIGWDAGAWIWELVCPSGGWSTGHMGWTA